MMETTAPKQHFLFDVLLPKVEVAAWVLSIAGFIAKWNLISLGNPMLIVGLGSLAYVYLLSAFRLETILNPFDSSMPDYNAPRSFYIDALLPKNAWIGGAVVWVGTLFRLMAWSGANQMLIVGTGVVLIAVVIRALNQRMNRHALLVGVVGIIMLYVPAETWVRQFHNDDPVLVRKMVYQLEHPRDPAARDSVQQYLKQKRNQR